MTMGKKKKFLLIPIVLISLILGASFIFLHQIYKRVVVSKDDVIRIGAQISPSPTPTPDPLAPKNILLMGYAGGDHEGATLTDTMIVARVDPRKENVTLVSIPRALGFPVPV